ncbi:MAG: fibronectin type III domain-containing protein [Candidatus Saccharibacteria bacterium]|nr:fibronectin type III domain-containing protein [Candidatus Saccharibacteria bacterium]
MRKINIVTITFTGLLIASVAFSMFGQNRQVHAFSGAGDGSQATPFIITTCTQLQEVQQELTKYYSLANDIDCSDTLNWNSGQGFIPIGSNGCCNNTTGHFKGNFNGNDHVIKNLYINNLSRGTDGTGLFGTIGAEGYVGHVGIQGGYLNVGERSGVLAGLNKGHIEFAFTDTNINTNGGSFTGNFVGSNYAGTINNSYAKGNVINGSDGIGGFAGYNNNNITSSFASGNVSGNGTNTGGFIGKQQAGTVTQIFATGSVSSPGVGGLIGGVNSGNFANLNWDSALSVKSDCWAIIDTTTPNNTSCTNRTSDSAYFRSLSNEPFVSFSSPSASSYLVADPGNLPKFSWHPTLLKTFPGAPANVQSEGSSAQVSLTWAPLLNVGNGTIEDYSIQYRLSTDSAWTTFGHDPNSSITNIIVDGLTNNVRYDLRVAAANEVGVGAYTEVDDVMVGTVPDQVSNLQFLNNVTSLGATWVAPSNTGTSAITGYDFAYSLAGQNTWGEYPVTSPAVGINGLAVGRYDIRARAKNIVGNGEWNYVYNKYLGVINYAISNCSDIQNMVNDPTGDYLLTQNIDCSGTATLNDNGSGGYFGFMPIQDFTGTLNGQGHTISGLYINRPNDCDVGLFASLNNDSSVHDITLDEVNVTGSCEVGGLVGRINGGAMIDAVHVKGNIHADYLPGGIVGYVYTDDGSSTIISNSTSDVSIGSSSNSGNYGYWGGVVGYAELNPGSLQIRNSRADVAINSSSANSVGGLIGYGDVENSSTLTISDSQSTGSISCANQCGGLIGTAYSYFEDSGDRPILNITTSKATSTILASGNSVGGLIGYIDANGLDTILSRTNYVSAVSPSLSANGANVGGLIGKSFNEDYDPTLAISQSFVKAVILVNGHDNAGGLIGEDGQITHISDSYFEGSVTAGAYNAGGFIASEIGIVTIDKSYVTSAETDRVSAQNGHAGGIIGYQNGEATITNSFVSVGENGPSAVGSVVGLNTGSYTTDSRVYVDAQSAGLNCYGNADNDDSCILVNLDGNDSNHFIGNSTNTPFTINLSPIWAFTDIWVIQEGKTPKLKWSIDLDSDGVQNNQESDAPNYGDANNDGTPDGNQSNVSSYVDIVSGKYAVLQTNCTSNQGVQIGSEAGGSSEDSMYDYPAGLVGFTATGCGSDVTVAQYYYGTFDISKIVIRKWKNNVYTTIPDAVLTNEVIAGKPVMKVVYHVIDGGPLDDDGTVNGRISDPTGPALLAIRPISSRFAGVGVPNTGISKL